MNTYNRVKEINNNKGNKKKDPLIQGKPQWGAFIGTALEYYDSALFWFMTPLLVPLFLPNMEPLTALILAYASYPLTIISRPFGAIVLGRIGDKYGRKKALTVSLIGTAMATGIVGCLPTYSAIGIGAPILFTLLRVIQKFFVAGEYNGGAIFLLEHTKEKKGLNSGMYCAFTVSGILTAAVVCSVVSILPEGWWRIAYFLAFLTALFGLYFRMNANETPEFESGKDLKEVSLRLRDKMKESWGPMLACLGVSACFSGMYTIHSSFTIAYLPLVTSFGTSQVMFINTITLSIYMIALPLFGRLGDILTFRKSMGIAAMLTVALSLPLFLLLKNDTFLSIFIFKATFALLSAWYIGPFHAWVQELFPVKSRYQLISLSYSIGSQIGALVPPMGLWLWKQTNIYYLPSVLVIGFGVIGLIGLYGMRESQDELSPEHS